MSRRALPTGDELQFVIARLGEWEIGLSITQVERILRYEAPEAWPAAPSFVAGRIHYGDGRVPLVDLRTRAQLRPVLHEETRSMVLATEELPMAVVVDQVKEVMRVDSRTIQPPSGEASPGVPAEAVSGLVEGAGRRIAIVNAARLLTGAERRELLEALK
jgi:chemotaxis signal transduction protein